MRGLIKAYQAWLTERAEQVPPRSGVDRRSKDRGTPDRRQVAPVTGEELKARLAEING